MKAAFNDNSLSWYVIRRCQNVNCLEIREIFFEYAPPNTDDCGALLNGDGVITAHAHGELVELHIPSPVMLTLPVTQFAQATERGAHHLFVICGAMVMRPHT